MSTERKGFGMTRQGDELRTNAVRGKVFPAAFEASAAIGRRHARSITACALPDDSEDRSAAYRARALVRRYAVANWLDGFTTLTFRNRLDPNDARDRCRSHFKRLVRTGSPFPYVWVVELDPRPHIHALMSFSHARRAVDKWRHGFVDLPEQIASVPDLREAAGYLAKDFGDTPVRPRYTAARGFQPESIPLSANTTEEFVAAASRQFQAEPESTTSGPGSIRALWTPSSLTNEK